MVGGGGRVLLCAQRLYYRRDQLDCPPPNGLNHYLPLNKTCAHGKGERFRATMALLYINIDVSKIDENCYKQTLASLPCFGAYRKSQFTVIMSLPQNTAYAHCSKYIIFTFS